MSPQGSNHLRVRNAPRGAVLYLQHPPPTEKNHRWARSDRKTVIKANLLESPPYSPTRGLRRACARPRGNCLYSPNFRKLVFSEAQVVFPPKQRAPLREHRRLSVADRALR